MRVLLRNLGKGFASFPVMFVFHCLLGVQTRNFAAKELFLLPPVARANLKLSKPHFTLIRTRGGKSGKAFLQPLSSEMALIFKRLLKRECWKGRGTEDGDKILAVVSGFHLLTLRGEFFARRHIFDQGSITTCANVRRSRSANLTRSFGLLRTVPSLRKRTTFTGLLEMTNWSA